MTSYNRQRKRGWRFPACLLLAGALATGVAPSLAAASGSGVKWFGKGDFGVGVGSDYVVNASIKNAKVAASASPYLKGKVFGRTFTVLGLDAKLGNYGSTDWNATQQNQKFHHTNISKWKYYGAVRPFGITVGFGDNNFISKKGDLQKGWEIYKWGKYYKQTILTFPIPLGIVTIQVSAGVMGYIEFKPKITLYGITSLVLTAAPQAGLGAYVEGAVNLALIRGGIGASLSLIEGYGGLSFNLDLFPGSAGVYLIYGMDMLKGKVYAFVDRIAIKCCFKKSWKRALTADLFSWLGQKARSFAQEEDAWRYIGKGRRGFLLEYDIKRTVDNAKWDSQNQTYVYEGFYDSMPADVRGMGSTVYKFELFKSWKKEKFAWMGQAGETELWSTQLYDYYQLMDWIRTQI